MDNDLQAIALPPALSYCIELKMIWPLIAASETRQ